MGACDSKQADIGAGVVDSEQHRTGGAGGGTYSPSGASLTPKADVRGWIPWINESTTHKTQTSTRSCTKTRSRRDVLSSMVPTNSIQTPRVETPHVALSNNSCYTVSYYVTQEDKRRTKEHNTRIAKSILVQLNGGRTGGEVAAEMKRDEEEVTKMEHVEHFLLRDCRMGPIGSTPTTQVQYPADCKELRVHAYFRTANGEWIQYKDKVYSTGRSRRTSFTLCALNCNITPYVQEPGTTKRK